MSHQTDDMGHKIFLALLALNLCLGVQVASSSSSSTPPRTCNSLTAAYRNDEKIFLFFGNRYMIFHKDKKVIKERGTVKELYRNLPDITVTAAFRPMRHSGFLILISGNSFYKIFNGRKRRGPLPITQLFGVRKRLSSGLDASATVGHRTFYFKGCSLIIKALNRNARTVYLKNIGLPCNFDAAWHDDGKVVMVKGPVNWTLNPWNLRHRPHCFYCTRPTTAAG